MYINNESNSTHDVCVAYELFVSFLFYSVVVVVIAAAVFFSSCSPRHFFRYFCSVPIPIHSSSSSFFFIFALQSRFFFSLLLLMLLLLPFHLIPFHCLMHGHRRFGCTLTMCAYKMYYVCVVKRLLSFVIAMRVEYERANKNQSKWASHHFAEEKKSHYSPFSFHFFFWHFSWSSSWRLFLVARPLYFTLSKISYSMKKC